MAQPAALPLRRPWGAALAVLAVALLLGCAESAEQTDLAACRAALDDERWSEALARCEALGTAEGSGLAATAALGRAGVTIPPLLSAFQDTALAGVPLVLYTYDVTTGTLAYSDVEHAIDLVQGLAAPQPGDWMTLLVASGVQIAALLRQTLSIAVDAGTRAVTIPGLTDLPSLPAAPTTADYQAVLEAAYAGAYYRDPPPEWGDPDDNPPSLARISRYVAANVAAAEALALAGRGLAALAAGAGLDAGACALDADGLTDGALAAAAFPRRLNTSAADYFHDALHYTLLDAAGAVDATKEWSGAFRLPSALLNPERVLIECDGDGTATLGEFGTCMDDPTVADPGILAPTAVAPANTLDPALTALADGTPLLCGDPAGCATWPLLPIDGDPATDESGVNGAQALSDLAAVLDALAPVNNADTAPDTSGLHCLAGDGRVHAREYDAFVRSLAP